MDIDTTIRWQLQHSWREHIAIRYYDNNVWSIDSKCVEYCCWTQTCWLQDGCVVLKGQSFDGRRGGFLTPPTRPIRLCDNSSDLVWRGQQRVQCRTRKRCCTHEDDAHGETP